VATASFPGEDPRFPRWPLRDRLAWERATTGAPIDFLDECPPLAGWARGTQENARWVISALLRWLEPRHPIPTDGSLADIMTPDVLLTYIRELLPRQAPGTVEYSVWLIDDVLRVLAPDQDWEWIKPISRRLQARARWQAPSPRPVIHSVTAYTLGLSTMQEGWSAEGVVDPSPCRTGLAIAFLAAAPMRIANFASLEIGRHLCRNGDRWIVRLGASETKTRRADVWPLAPVLGLYLDDYLLVSSVFVTVAGGTAWPSHAMAEVSLKNGNWYKSYTDAAVQGGLAMKVERIYNSKTDFARGVFGAGWGFEYEVWIEPAEDGSVIIHEWGGGAENRFMPKDVAPLPVEQVVDQLVETAGRRMLFGSDVERQDYRKKLEQDQSFRHQEWERFREQGLVNPQPIPEGTMLYSQLFGNQLLKRIRDGWERNSTSDRTVEQFDEQGRLRRVAGSNGDFILLAYEDGHLRSMTDDAGRKFDFQFDQSGGHVIKLTDQLGRSATYEYDGDKLSSSTDTDGNQYHYEYDNVIPVPNMTAIRYSDGSSVVIQYYGPEKQWNVRQVKDRDNTVSTYSYTVTSPLDQKVVVDVADQHGQKLSSARYHYIMARDDRGGEFQKELDAKIDGDETRTTYNQNGLPLSIWHNGAVTRFTYDAKGRVTLKATMEEVTKLTYDSRTDKISDVIRTVNGKQIFHSAFEYDANGNLLRAQDDSGHLVTLDYDEKGRVKVLNTGGSRMTFVYNLASEPVSISIQGIGEIRIEYDADDEIKNVNSPQGKDVALKIQSLLQSLMDLIRPAGVTLSF
jgi:YD repeat-containing protein